MNTLLTMLLCHMIGDYVLRSDYIARTKGENWYHLFVHSVLYCVPFLIACDMEAKSLWDLFTSHFLIDAGKARFKAIGYVGDQVLHYIVIFLLWPEIVNYTL